MSANKFYMSPEGTDSRTATITLHKIGEPITNAIMAIPQGAPKVEITVDEARYSLDHWSIQTVGGVEHLVATWVPKPAEIWPWPLKTPRRGFWRRMAFWR